MADMGAAMTFAEIVKARMGKKTALVCPVDAGDLMVLVPPRGGVSDAAQWDMWAAASEVYVLGGRVSLGEGWVPETSLETPETDRISKAYGRNVTQVFRRDVRSWGPFNTV